MRLDEVGKEKVSVSPSTECTHIHARNIDDAFL